MKKTRRFLCLLGALLGLSGCPDNPCSTGEVPIPSTSFQQEIDVILMGKEVRLRLSPQTSGSCDPNADIPAPTSFTAEISDPDNHPVDNQATLGTPSTSSATLRFTPTQQGRYHIFAAFDPVGGIQQLDLYAARDRSPEAPVETLTQSCNALERTRRGGWLCDTDYVRDGTVLWRFPGARMAASGDVVWVVTPTQIHRFVDTGTTLELVDTLDNTQGIALFLLATDDELVILHSNTFERIVFDGTKLSATGGTTWVPGTAPLGQTALQALMLRTGDQLAIVTATLSRIDFTVLQLCPYQLKEGRFVSTGDGCQFVGQEVLGYEPNVLWTGIRAGFSGTFSEVHRQEWTGTTLVDQASLPLGQRFQATLTSPELRNTAVPVIVPFLSPLSQGPTAVVPVYSPERHGILLEMLDSTIPAPSASPALLWGAPSSTGTGESIRIRPTSP